MIQVRDLGKTYAGAEAPALSGLSFHCLAGEVVGLLGPTGAGTTTTLRILSTALRPTAGRATVVGHDVVARPEAVRANMAFCRATPASTVA